MDFDSFHAENLKRSEWTNVPSFQLSHLRNKLKAEESKLKAVESKIGSPNVSRIVEDIEETYFTFLERDRYDSTPHEAEWVRIVLDSIKSEFPSLPLVV